MMPAYPLQRVLNAARAPNPYRPLHEKEKPLMGLGENYGKESDAC